MLVGKFLLRPSEQAHQCSAELILATKDIPGPEGHSGCVPPVHVLTVHAMDPQTTDVLCGELTSLSSGGTEGLRGVEATMRAEAQRRDKKVKDLHSWLFINLSSCNIPRPPCQPCLVSGSPGFRPTQAEGLFLQRFHSDPQAPQLEIGGHWGSVNGTGHCSGSLQGVRVSTEEGKGRAWTQGLWALRAACPVEARCQSDIWSFNKGTE